MKKSISAFLALIILFVLSGCLGKRQTIAPDNSEKKTIWISLFSGGFGTGWMDEVLKDYNATQEKFFFKRVDDNKLSTKDITIRVESGVNNATLFFADSSDIDELIYGDYLLNLNDIYETKENGKTLKERIWDYDLFKEAYSDNKGNLYAVPFTQGVCGVIYDHDLFTQLNLFLKDSTTSNGLTKGMDGIEGTYDDGLPKTMSEFDQLIQTLNRASVIPFIYSDLYANDMLEPICDIVWGMYDGKTNYTNTLLFDGDYTDPETGTVTHLTPETGYKVYTDRLAKGKYKAVDFLNTYLVNTGYICKGIDGYSHTDTQGKYVLSHNENPIAMIFDGSWWENEAKPYFAVDVKRNGEEYAYGKRDFRIMPIPAYDGHSSESNQKFYLPTNSNGSIFAVKTKDEEVNQAMKDFIKYFTTSEVLARFSMYNSTMLPYDYEMSEEQINKMTKFGQNYYEIIHSNNVEIIRPDLLYSLSPLYLATEAPERFYVTVSGNKYTRFYGALKENGYKSLIDALPKVYSETTWRNMYNSVKDYYVNGTGNS